MSRYVLKEPQDISGAYYLVEMVPSLENQLTQFVGSAAADCLSVFETQVPDQALLDFRCCKSLSITSFATLVSNLDIQATDGRNLAVTALDSQHSI